MTEKSDFGKVFDAACGHFPDLISRNTAYIYAWLEAGCDVDKDIIPTIDRLCKYKKESGDRITGFKYFNNAVLKAYKERLEAEADVSEGVRPNQPPNDAKRAEMIARTVRVFGKRDPELERWLDDYEFKFGKVRLDTKH